VFPVPPPGVADNQYVTAIHANDRTQSEPHKGDNRRQDRKLRQCNTEHPKFLRAQKILYTN